MQLFKEELEKITNLLKDLQDYEPHPEKLTVGSTVPCKLYRELYTLITDCVKYTLGVPTALAQRLLSILLSLNRITAYAVYLSSNNVDLEKIYYDTWDYLKRRSKVLYASITKAIK